MRKSLAFCIILFFLLAGCKNNERVLFCEGVTPEGEAMKCGKKFYSGDLSVIIKPEGEIEEKSLMVKIYQEGDNSDPMTREIKIEKDKTSYQMSLPFYNEGKYSLRVFAGGKKLTEASVEIVE